jgi:hypothetical protein
MPKLILKRKKRPEKTYFACQEPPVGGPANGRTPTRQGNLYDVTFANHDYLLRSPARRSAFTSALSVGAKTIS